MNNILIIIRREFLTRVQKKSFIILTLLMPFIFAAIVAVPIALASIKGGEQKTVYVVDKTSRYLAAFKDTESYRFEPKAADSPAFYADSSDVEAVIVVTDNLAQNPSAVTISAKKPVSAELLQYAESTLNDCVRRDKLAAYDVPQLEEMMTDLQSRLSVRTVIRSADGKDDKSTNTGIAIAAGFIFTFLIYMFVMSYGSMVMQGVMEEKTNRILEIMVSTVKPFHLMFGKIVGVALVGFAQVAVWAVMLTALLFIGSAVFGIDTAQPAAGAMTQMTPAAAAQMQAAEPSEAAEIMSALMNLPFAELGILFVLYFIGGYLLYASFFAAVGASINSQEDSGQFIMPVILIMVFGLYAAMGCVENTDGPLAFWTSMIPLTSPIVMLVRVPFGVPLWQEALSLVILFATALLIIWISGRIYRVGILMYGKKPTFGEMLKWIRYT